MPPRQQTNHTQEENPTTLTRVLVVGAGPGGLLATINLLRRNNVADAPKYQVTLVDPGVDYGNLDEAGLSKRRSWMIGLSAHGLNAIQEIPRLYEDYIQGVGVPVRKGTIGIGATFKSTTDVDETYGFCVDRNYVCGAIARYLNDNFAHDAQFVSHYDTRALFVDSENRKVMVRPNHNPTEMNALEYDILLGCDGIRSIVRNSFITQHREFEFDITDNFSTYKSLHLSLPEDVGEGHFMTLLNCLPNASAIVLPERGQKINIACGWQVNQTVDEALLSDDLDVVEDYLKENFKIFNINCKEFAEQWTQQSFQSTQMVHCNFYHSTKLNALLLGDAAHATVPNIGQGMNTALADAAALNQLLDIHKDNWDHVLPAFSEERVKEGNALTELSFHTFSVDASTMMSIALRQNLHRMLNKILPEWMLEPEPIMAIGKGMKLSTAYNKMVKYGYMAKSRRINQDTKRAYFEKKSGMVQEKKSSWTLNNKLVVAALAAAISVGMTFCRDNGKRL